MLTRLVYFSENHAGGLSSRMVAALNDILETSNRNNRRDDITGALLFDTLWFVQILEGERDAVSAALRRIVSDPRHDGLTIMDAGPIEARAFGNWWMGLGMLRAENDALYARHGLGPRLDPRVMTGQQALGLALALARTGLQRSLAAVA